MNSNRCQLRPRARSVCACERVALVAEPISSISSKCAVPLFELARADRYMKRSALGKGAQTQQSLFAEARHGRERVHTGEDTHAGELYAGAERVISEHAHPASVVRGLAHALEGRSGR